MKSTTKLKVDIDPSIIPVALTLRKVEYILSGKIKPPLKDLVWTYYTLKMLAPEEDDLLWRLVEHIGNAIKYN
ncbi:MAG: hypothetical protein WC947_10275 [Elusimicrobiota bacterium]